jgi:predicted P-loop ATPase
MGVEDSDYTREVSRLIFAGGIHRLYNPGCKFEDMPVLVGGQGAGKSSFVRFLAIEDRFFTELTTIDGKEGSEGVEGAWIVEVSELLALTKTKEQEAVKAYLSRLVDKYRPAYGRHIVERKRTCAFIGTTNREQFITDKTGGRRFYPVRCRNTGYDLFDHEEECREYIKQCWAEAYHKMHSDFMNPYATRSVKPQIEVAQESAMEEDFRIGMVQNWLDKHAPENVCGGMIWENALHRELSHFTKADQTQIGLIMNNNVTGWDKCKPGQMKTFERYGRQRFWVRSKEVVHPIEPMPNDFTPF